MKKIFTIKKLIAVLVLAAVAAAVAFAMNSQKIEVKVATIDAGPVERIISESGSVESLTSAVVSSQVAGQVAFVSVSAGDEARAGQLLATYTRGLGAADINGLRAQLSGLQSDLDQARDRSERSGRLYAEGAVSYEEYNQTVTALNQLETQAAALRYSIESMAAAAGAGGVTAPISGTVTAVFVRDGEMVAPGSPMFEISNLEERYVRVNLVSEDADETSPGDAVRVYSESGALIDGDAFVGKIHARAQDVLSDLGIVQKRVPTEITLRVSNFPRLGSDVQVEIITEKRENAPRVPDSAYIEMNKEHFAYVVQDGKARLRKIQLGLVGESFTEVLDGLRQGDLVILSPAPEIEDGVSVTVQL